MTEDFKKPFSDWFKEFIEQFSDSPNQSAIRYAIGEEGDVHAIRDGEKKATLWELFSAVHAGLEKTQEFNTFTLEKLKAKCEALINSAKCRHKGLIKVIKYFKTLAAEIELKELEREITAKEFERYDLLTKKLSTITTNEAREYILLLAKFFSGKNEKDLFLAKRILSTPELVTILLSEHEVNQEQKSAWKSICNVLYKHNKLLESLSDIHNNHPIPVWADEVLKETLKEEFRIRQIPKLLVETRFARLQVRPLNHNLELDIPQVADNQELKNIDSRFLSHYNDLLAEAGAEVFVERELPLIIPPGTASKMQHIEKEIAKQTILKKIQNPRRFSSPY